MKGRVKMAHMDYYNKDKIKVPSVTTVIGILNKDGLIQWANSIGKRGIDYKKFLNERALVGSVAHELIEAHLSDKNPALFCSNEIKSEATQILNTLKVATEGIKFYNHEFELSLSSDRFGGTLDMLCDIEINGELNTVLVDFKTSKKPYITQFIQLGAYLELLRLNNHPRYNDIKYCMIFSVNKSTCTFQYITKENTLKYFTKMFLSLLDTYEIWSIVQLEGLNDSVTEVM